MLALEQTARGVIVPVRARAGGRRNAILGVRDGALRVEVTAAPEKGKANRAIIALLSKTFTVPKSAIKIIGGETSKQKRFLVMGCNADRIRTTIESISPAES